MSHNKGQKNTRSGLQPVDSPRNTPRAINISRTDKGRDSKLTPDESIESIHRGHEEGESEFKTFQKELKSMLKAMEERMNNKFTLIDQKFSGIFKELKEEMSLMKSDLQTAKTKVEGLGTRVNEIEKSIEFNSDTVADLKREQEERLVQTEQKLNDKIKELDNKLLLLEKHDRKYNLLFYGIQEQQQEKVADTLRHIFKTDLHIDDNRVDNMHFISCHRIPSEGQGPRPIILRFSSSEDKDLVLSESYRLAGTRRRILTDLPLQMKKERARLAREAYKIRHTEELQTRIRDKGLEVYLQVRQNDHDRWVLRDI